MIQRALVPRLIAAAALAAAITWAVWALLLKDAEELPATAYRRITEFEELAARNGYARLN